MEVLRLAPPAKPHHFHGYGPAGAKRRAQLGVIDNSDVTMAGLSDDLLAEHRPAAAFDEVQLGANLVGAIDGDVNLSGKIISQQGNAELLCRDGRRRRRWHSHDVVEQAVAQQVSKATCRVNRGAACAKSDDHAGGDKLERALSGLLFVLLDRG